MILSSCRGSSEWHRIAVTLEDPVKSNRSRLPEIFGVEASDFPFSFCFPLLMTFDLPFRFI